MALSVKIEIKYDVAKRAYVGKYLRDGKVLAMTTDTENGDPEDFDYGLGELLKQTK